jgi:hypothetical protein
MDVNYCFSLHQGDLHYAKIRKKTGCYFKIGIINWRGSLT